MKERRMKNYWHKKENYELRIMNYELKVVLLHQIIK